MNDPPDWPAPPFDPDSYDGPDQGRPVDLRPTIRLGPRVDLVEEDIVAALGRADLYCRSGRLVRVVGDQIREISADALVPVISRAADFERMAFVGGEWTVQRCQPTRQLAKSLVGRDAFPGVRMLEGITRVPILFPDGSVCSTPGYHEGSRLVYAPDGDPPWLIDNPTPEHAAAAMNELLEIVAEYEFMELCDTSAWLALLLTLVGRSAYRGASPMFLSTANQARMGKTTIIQLAGLIAHGEVTPTVTWPTEDAELGKRVDSFVFAGRDLVLWDNIRGPIGGPSLEAVLTTTRHEGRVLGFSEMRTATARTVWAASGNGATLKGDMAGRTLPIRLYWDQPSPELRTFQIPDIVGWVRERRSRFLGAAITILRAFLLARPTVDLPTWGSYEAWSRLIRGSIVWLGLPDPIGTREGVEAIDGGSGGHDRLVQLAAAVFGLGHFTAGQLAERVDGVGLQPGATLAADWSLADARDVVAMLGAWDRTAKCCDRIRLGLRLSEYLDRPTLDGLRIRRATGAEGKPRKTRARAPLFVVVGQAGAGQGAP